MARTRSSGKQFLALLASSSRPVYALDDRRKILYCNQACAEWLGVDAAELVGRRCDYHAGDVPTDELAAGLCPPPEAFCGTQVTSDVTCRDAAGMVSRRTAEFCPLDGGSAECVGVVVFVSRAASPLVDTPSQPSTTSSDLHDQLRVLIQQVRREYRVDRLVGESLAIARVRDQVRLAIAGRSSVLVVGPPGSGREHVARTIHCGAQPETAGPLMPLSSGSLDAELMQTTLLAFLARCREADALQTAAVLLLDADQLTPACQTELLAYLCLPTFGLRTLVTARHRLLDLAEDGEFDRDLALALSTLVIEIPALASRRQDIPTVAQYFVEAHNSAGEKQHSGFTVEAIDRLGALPWDHDMDELAEIVEEAWRGSEGPWITEADMPKRVDLLTSAAAHPARVDPIVPLDDFLVEIERELIQRAMNRAKGNKAQAARLLGIHRARLLRRLSQLALDGDN